MTKTLFASLVFAGYLMAAEPICVRNYGEAICGQFPDTYTFVQPADTDEEDEVKVCARIYNAFFCAGAQKEYNLVTALNGEKICVLNTNQPPVSNLCATVSQFYNYIKSK